MTEQMKVPRGPHPVLNQSKLGAFRTPPRRPGPHYAINPQRRQRQPKAAPQIPVPWGLRFPPHLESPMPPPQPRAGPAAGVKLVTELPWRGRSAVPPWLPAGIGASPTSGKGSAKGPLPPSGPQKLGVPGFLWGPSWEPRLSREDQPHARGPGTLLPAQQGRCNEGTRRGRKEGWRGSTWLQHCSVWAGHLLPRPPSLGLLPRGGEGEQVVAAALICPSWPWVSGE